MFPDFEKEIDSLYGLSDDLCDRTKERLPCLKVMSKTWLLTILYPLIALLYRYHVDAPWLNLPDRFGEWKNVYRHLHQCDENDVNERIFHYLPTGNANGYIVIEKPYYPGVST